MTSLSSKNNSALATVISRAPFIAKITENHDLPEPLRRSLVLRTHQARGKQPDGFRLVLTDDGPEDNAGWINLVKLDERLRYLSEGDVIKFFPDSLEIQVLYRRTANINVFLLTERCNSFCLMCSQPPRDIDDSYRVSDVMQTLPLVDRGTPELMFSGGEPTLLGDDLFKLVRSAEALLPHTSLHILTNGRNFKNPLLATKLAAAGHHDLMLGIPIYSDVPWSHDFIVQADGAFDETIKGILNLKRNKVRVEIRVVLHQQNYKRLPQLAEFIGRNLLFVDQVALMGLETTGFTKANLEALWIDPFDYQAELESAMVIFRRFGMKALIFNHQLCVIPPSIRNRSVQSISDWKNEFLPECSDCDLKPTCGGFFSSARLRRSSHIRPVRNSQSAKH